MIVWTHRFLDVALPIFTLYVITRFYGPLWSDKYQVLGILGGLLLVIFNQGAGVYSQWRGRSIFAGFRLVLQGWFATWLTLLALGFMFKDSAYFSRVVLVSWAIITPIVLFTYHLILRSAIGFFRMKGWNAKKVAILGAGDLGQRLVKILNDAKMLGLIPISFFDDDKKKLDKVFYSIPVSGTIDHFLNIEFLELAYDEIYITLPLRSEARIKEILNALADRTVIVKFVPDCFSFDLLHSRYSDVGGIPIISVYDSPLNSTSSKIIKRTEDIILSALIIIFLLPIIPIIAIAIKTDSKGPLIFKQKRYGLNGKEINVWKFRSMTVCEKTGPIIQAKKGDVRVTKIGAFLRKTSLDELPQFIHSLTGRMSVVGPRPHAKAHNELYRKKIPKYMLRHTVKPGITGWAQINDLRGETDTLDKMEKRIDFDLYYIDNWTLWMDIKIILLTIIRGFISKNAF